MVGTGDEASQVIFSSPKIGNSALRISQGEAKDGGVFDTQASRKGEYGQHQNENCLPLSHKHPARVNRHGNLYRDGQL